MRGKALQGDGLCCSILREDAKNAKCFIGESIHAREASTMIKNNVPGYESPVVMVLKARARIARERKRELHALRVDIDITDLLQIAYKILYQTREEQDRWIYEISERRLKL